MRCRQFLRLLSSISIFGLAVRAARPGLEPAASLDHVADQAIWSKDGEDPCERYNAKSVRKWFQWARSPVKEPRCRCNWYWYPNKQDPGFTSLLPSQGCRATKGNIIQDYKFLLKEVDPKTCRCLTHQEMIKERSSPVKVSALKFCSAIMEQIVSIGAKPAYSLRRFLRKKLNVTSDLCREVLTGTVEHSGEWYDGAAQLSEHNATKGLGYLDPLVTGSVAQSRHHHLLKHVCADECEAIVQQTQESLWDMSHEVRHNVVPFEQTCADRVVRKVEAEVLGCCGRACGYNNRSHSCMAWPFFTRDEKVAWLEECCTEYNVLNGSSREQMCKSVLTQEQARRVSQNSTKAKNGTDVGGAYIGQEPRLLWTKKGISKFKEQLKKLTRKPRKDDPVDSDFLESHTNISKVGIQKGWFVEEKIPGGRAGPTSFVEIHASSCTSQKLKELKHCGEDQKVQVLLTCLREGGWQVTDKDEIDEPCDVNPTAAVRVATPDDCLTWNFSEVGIKRRVFVYENEAPAECKEPKDCVPALPILCHFHSDTSKCNSLEGEGVSVDHFDRHGFADYLYWIDESNVQDRQRQMPHDNAKVTAALKRS